LIHHRQNQDSRTEIEARRAAFIKQYAKIFRQTPLKSEEYIRKVLDYPTTPQVGPLVEIVDTSSTVNLIVDRPTGLRMMRIAFNVKTTTPFGKMMAATAGVTGEEPWEIKFLFDGVRLESSETPRDYDMEDGDVIDAVISQRGC
jgi:hypothetical protein